VLRDAVMLTVTLEGEDYEAVKAVAKKRGLSLGGVIREAVRKYVRGRKR
jgi:hypothetical protein